MLPIFGDVFREHDRDSCGRYWLAWKQGRIARNGPTILPNVEWEDLREPDYPEAATLLSHTDVDDKLEAALNAHGFVTLRLTDFSV